MDEADWELAQVFQIVFVVFLLISSLYGFGQHNTDLDAYNIMMATKVELMGQFSVSLAMGLSKTSVALLLLRIINIFWYVLHCSEEPVQHMCSRELTQRVGKDVFSGSGYSQCCFSAYCSPSPALLNAHRWSHCGIPRSLWWLAP